MRDLAIVIVSYNAATDLARCLTSLTETPPAATHEIVVVDNGSVDESVATAKRFPVRVIESGGNVGFARACNAGIRATQSRDILLLNSDTIVPAGALDRLRGVLAADPHAAAVGPRLVDAQGRAELSFGRMLTPIAEWRQRQLMTGLAQNDARIVAQVEAMTRRGQMPDWVSGACLLVRRADADAVGLLDERYFMYTEDVDFCAALRARGRRILFTSDVEIVHLRGRSAAAAPDATRAAYRRSHIAFYEKHHPLLAPLVRWYHQKKPL